MSRPIARGVMVALLALSGCRFESTPRAGARIPCGPNGECPKPWECRPEDRYCHPAGANLDAPGIVAFDLAPKRGRAGTAFRLSLVASKPLAGTPTVGPLPFVASPDESRPDALTWVFRFEAKGTEPEGEQGLFVVLRDVDGNTATVPLPGFVLDFTPPALLADGVKITPEVARPGDRVVVQIDLDETVDDGATLVVGGSGLSELSSTVRGSNSLLFRLAAPGTMGDGSYPLVIKHAVDLSGNPSGDIGLPKKIVVDGTPPTVTNFTLSRTRLSRVAAFSNLQATFNVSADAVTVRGWVRDRPMTCTALPATSVTCTYAVAATDTEGQGNVRVEADDLAGNTATASGPVEFDFTAPSVAANSVALYLAPPTSSPVSTVTAVTVGGAFTVNFAFSEPSAMPVDVHVGPLSMTCTAVSPTFANCTSVLGAGQLSDGTQTVSVALVDAVGNSSNTVLGTVRVDTAVPAPPDVATAGRVEYLRRPWGSFAEGLSPRFGVRGGASAVEGAGTLVFYSAATAPRSELGRGSSAANGSFGPIDLQPTDRAQVFASFVDGAGNQSPAVLVRDVLMTATLLGKTAGSTVVNPNTLWGETQAKPDALPVADPARAAYGLAPATLNQVWTGTRAAWREFPLPMGPRARAAMVFDTLRQRTLLFGGLFGTINLSETWEYPSAVQKWSKPFEANAPNTAPAGRWGAAAAFDPVRARMVVMGGNGGSGAFGETWEYDVVTQSWSKPITASPPSFSPGGRYYASMAADAVTGKMVLVGGRSSSGAPLQDTWEYDGATHTWSKPASANVPNVTPPVSALSASIDTTRRSLLLFCVNETWEYDLVAQTWSRPASANAPNLSPFGFTSAAQGYDPVRKVTVLLGASSSAGPNTETWEYNGTTRTWSKPAAGNAPNAVPPWGTGLAGAFDTSRSAFVAFGGQLSASTSGDTWEYAGSPASWTKPVSALPSSPVPGAHSNDMLVYDSLRSRTVLFGLGVGFAGSFTTETYELDTALSSWTRPSTANSPALIPSAQTAASVAFDSFRNKVVLFGGNNAATTLAETWEYDVATQVWAKPAAANSPNPAPAARFGHRAVFDPVRKKMLVFAGYSFSTGLLTDAWEYDVATQTWAKPASANAPNAVPAGRYDYGMVFDAPRGKAVLFGGLSVPSPTDTWEYDSATQTWAKPATANAPNLTPTLTSNTAFAYDTLRSRVVSFGGNSYVGNNSNELWEYDGATKTWSQPALANAPNWAPPGRNSHMAVYDVARKRMLVYAGSGWADLWEYEATGFPDGFPTLTAFFNTSAGGYADTAAAQATLAVKAGGSGIAVPATTPIDGVVVSRWSFDGWKTLGTTDAGTSSPGAASYVILDPVQLLQAQTRGDFYFQVAPRGLNADGGATLTVQEAELVVRYRLP